MYNKKIPKIRRFKSWGHLILKINHPYAHEWIKNPSIPKMISHLGIWVWEETIETHNKKTLVFLESNSESNLISHYKKSIALYYPMLLNQDIEFEYVTC